MLLALLAQAPAPPSAPPADLTPVLLTAAGALIGVVATASYQALNARWQRAHERQGRAFDKRFDVYSNFLTNMNKWGIYMEDHGRVGQGEKLRSRISPDQLQEISGEVLNSVGPLEILGNKQTRAALEGLLQHLRVGEAPPEEARKKAREAIRKELGIDR